MNDELVSSLRICAEGEHCDKCGKWDIKQNGGRNACEYAICTEAADAIEELLGTANAISPTRLSGESSTFPQSLRQRNSPEIPESWRIKL